MMHMKTGDEMATWLVDVIHQIYRRPEMYAATRSELESALWHYHFFWAWVVGRQGEFIDARTEEMIENPEYDHAMRSHELVGESLEHNRAIFVPIVTYWRCVDQRLDLFEPSGSESA
jgi:hypothetical protein